MRKRTFPILLATAALMTAIAPAATARDLTDVGYIDQSAIAALPAFQSVSRQLAAYKTQLDGQYAAAMRGAHTPAARAQVTQEFNGRMAREQQQLAGPAFMRVQLAIASAASNHGLSIVVDKRIIIYGGVDITQQVVRLLQSSQQILPLGTQPPPSEIGYVDQNVLQNSAPVRAASSQLATFAEKERQIFGAQFTAAGHDTAKQQQIAAAYNQAMNNEQQQVLKPVVARTQQVTSQVAQRRGLLLVIDRADVLYGGTDITTDVQNALGK
jgi:outer membrane protein